LQRQCCNGPSFVASTTIGKGGGDRKRPPRDRILPGAPSFPRENEATLLGTHHSVGVITLMSRVDLVAL
jgi:hypothetical protein